MPAYDAGSKPGLSPEAATLHDLQKDRDRGEKIDRQVQEAGVFYHIVTSHFSTGGNLTPHETVYETDKIGRRNKTRGGGGGAQKKDRSSRQEHESTSNRRRGGGVKKAVGLKGRVEN